MAVLHSLTLAQRSDAPAIARMSRDLIEQGLGWTWTSPRVLRSIRDSQTNVLVARHADAGLAGFGIMKYHDDEAHLLLLAVQPASQRQGLGRAMVDWLAASARVAGLASIQLEARASNVAARAFYAQLGYREVAQVAGYYSGREASVRMVCALNSRGA